MRFSTWLVFLALLVGLAVCVPEPTVLPTARIEPTATRVPPTSTPTDARRALSETGSSPTAEEWEKASLVQTGLDVDTMGAFRRALHSPNYENVHSVLLVKDGKLVFEMYRGVYGPDRKQEVAGDQNPAEHLTAYIDFRTHQYERVR